MFITSSRKANVSLKSFTKKLSYLLPNVKYVPRGQTNIKKLYDKARYLGHKHFLKTTNPKSNNILLQQYTQKGESYFLDKSYLLEPISTDINTYVFVFKSLKDVNKPKELFCFLDDYQQDDSLLEIKENKSIVSFVYNQKEINFSFKIIDEK